MHSTEGPSGFRSTTTQISNASDTTPKHLVLRLKGIKEGLKEQQTQLEQKVYEQSAILSQSVLGQSMLSQSVILPPQTTASSSSLSSTNVSYIPPEEVEDSELEERFYDCEETEIALEDTRADIRNIEDQEVIAEKMVQAEDSHAKEQEQLSLLQRVGVLAKKTVERSGTTFISALVTGGVAVTAPFTAPAIIGTLIAFGAGTVAANEIRKMIMGTLSDLGANDHIKAIENALNNIEERNAAQEDSIHRAIDMQQQVHANIREVDRYMDELVVKLQTAEGDVKDVILNLLSNLERTKRDLIQQEYSLGSALKCSQQSMIVLSAQKQKLKGLLEQKYEIKTEADLEKVVEGLNKEIAAVMAMSDEAYQHQLNSTKYILNALEMHGSLKETNRTTSELLGKMNALEEQLKQARQKVLQMQLELENAKEANQLVGDELDLQKKLIQEQKVDLQVAKDQLEKEKQIEKFGQESMMFGHVIAGTAGGVLGFVIGGGIGSTPGAIAGTALLGNVAVRGVHYARKFMRTMKKIDSDNTLEKLGGKFKTDSSDKVAISAEYSYSQGSIVGAYGAKSLWNFGVNSLSYVTGKEVGSEWKSNRAGVVTCSVGGATFNLSFDKKDANAAVYGAVSIDEQQKLSAALSKALDEKSISPGAVLTLLDSLSQVQIGKETIVMVSKASPAMQTLREKCVLMLVKGEEKTKDI